MEGWIISPRQRPQAARIRGGMYRDISTRLDRRIIELGEQQR
jgi:hypothetical protein